ncbi:hypothetical protein WHR41_09374 [Cladosporium halotolerans]|uniref:Uncharacterized protein n=1 Tax=Cladosporium halotolerans TaxID=1052096 RepID=A0AB34KF07_9PEZI
MKTAALTIASLSTFSQVVFADYGWQFGNAFSTGPVATNSFIRESTTTLVLPEVNSPQTGNLALWPGMGTSGGDLIQALAISVADGSAGCPKESGKWCIVASTLEGSQQMGDAVSAGAGTQVTMDYKYNDSTKKYDQTVSVDGKVVSKLSTDSGVAQGWGTATECQSAACGKYASHKYINTKIIMDVADPNYAQTKGTTGASGELVTNDGGKTWTVDTITIEGGEFV